MQIEQKKWTATGGWAISKGPIKEKKAELVLVFGDRASLADPKRFEEIKAFYPEAQILSASTSGNIQDVNLDDLSIVTTAIFFDKGSRVEVQKINIKEVEGSFLAGSLLGSQLSKEDLKHVFMLSDGHIVNGSELVKGMLKELPSSVALTGGLAGDATHFQKTIVGINEPGKEGEIAVVGFYGPHLQFGYGSIGGWDAFGIERKITRSRNNVLYELDGKSALELYKRYLGDQAKDLPGSALLFPLSIRQDSKSPSLVRTILSVNEADQSMTFAGDIPEGWLAQLMKANFDRLIEGAAHAARSSYQMGGSTPPDLAILISCVGRRIVLDQRTEDELESIQEVIGKNAAITGFYSYGEIAPSSSNAGCDLHNQTMTITTISEK